MIRKIKTVAIIMFYIAVLLVIAVYLQNGNGAFSHFFENANLYIRNLRNVHTPAATSSIEAFEFALPNVEAVASKGSPGRGVLQISLICKSIFSIIPFSAILSFGCSCRIFSYFHSAGKILRFCPGKRSLRNTAFAGVKSFFPKPNHTTLYRF